MPVPVRDAVISVVPTEHGEDQLMASTPGAITSPEVVFGTGPLMAYGIVPPSILLCHGQST